MRKIKLAYLISTLDTGGAERQLVNTVNGLDYDKYEVKIFVLKNRLTLAKQLNSTVSVEVLNVQSYANILELRTVLKKIEMYKPDILHSQMYASNILARTYKFYDKNCKVVNHIHGLGTWLKLPHILLDRALLKYVDKILVVSKRSYDIRLKRERYPKAKLDVLYNSIDVKKYAVEDKGRASLEYIFGSACRLVPIKQLDTIINIIEYLYRKGVRVKYLVAGDGPELENLNEIVIQKGLQDIIVFHGNVSDMSSFYSSIDILIMNSKTEDMPLSIVEAFASGLHVIASDIGGISELLQNNDGLLFDPTTPLEDIADKISKYLNNINVHVRSTKNIEYANVKFSNYVHQKKLYQIYTELLNGK